VPGAECILDYGILATPVTHERPAHPSVAGSRLLRPGAAVVDRHYTVLFVAVLAIGAFNLWFRIGAELVGEWDEALYAITAAELPRTDWIGTTFQGALDYYNTKPPLNVWLIALAFKAFGHNLVALRLVSTTAAWLSVAVLMLWTRRAWNRTVSIASGVVLATCFAYIHEHAGRSANTDALFTLLLLLVVVALWAAVTRHAKHLVWIGPIAAAVFLLRGMGVLMPLAIVGLVAIAGGWTRLRAWAAPGAAAALIFAVPVAAWAVARYQLDQWEFLSRLFWYDFVARSATTIEGHQHGPLFYLNILQKHQFDWIAAAVAAALLFPVALPAGRAMAILSQSRRHGLAVLLGAWGIATFLLPTLMQTKLPWYLNAFYPLFAVLVALVLAHAISHASDSTAWRRRALASVVLLMFAVAETKLVWYSYHYRDLTRTDQAVMLSYRTRLAGQRLYRDRLDNGGDFVARSVVGAEPHHAADLAIFLAESQPNDYFLTSEDLTHPDLEFIGAAGGFHLYRRCEGPPAARHAQPAARRASIPPV
jgi:4-amino-4-deoxy-L-arabinose transferase-like glycosyltransferase